MPHATPLRSRRPNRRLLVRKPAVTYFQVPSLAPGVRPSHHTFDAVIRRLRALPPDSYAIIPTTPDSGSSFGCMATVTADGSVELDLWIPSPAAGADA